MPVSVPINPVRMPLIVDLLMPKIVVPGTAGTGLGFAAISTSSIFAEFNRVPMRFFDQLVSVTLA
jgi:hypothetical protein